MNVRLEWFYVTKRRLECGYERILIHKLLIWMILLISEKYVGNIALSKVVIGYSKRNNEF